MLLNKEHFGPGAGPSAQSGNGPFVRHRGGGGWRYARDANEDDAPYYVRYIIYLRAAPDINVRVTNSRTHFKAKYIVHVYIRRSIIRNDDDVRHNHHFYVLNNDNNNNDFSLDRAKVTQYIRAS
jgi:hypothetical protein